MEFIKQYLDNVQWDFVGKRYIAGGISLVLVLASWAAFLVIGPNYAIDFTGGTEILLRFSDDVDIADVREALSDLDLGADAVQAVGAARLNQFAVRIQDPAFGMEGLVSDVEGKLRGAFGADWLTEPIGVSAEVGARFTVNHKPPTVPPADVRAALADVEGVSVQPGKEENQVIVTVPGLSSLIAKRIQASIGDREFEVLSVDAVGPKVGAELRRQGLVAILATLALVLVYVAFRFDIGFAPGAIVALIHDVSVTVGVFVLFQLPFDVSMIGALLTIIGYSLNDTIVIYDRIRENREKYRRGSLAELINTSVCETFSRTVTTSLTVLLAILSFLTLGGEVMRNFAIAMTLGLFFGAYSTIYVASPMLLLMEDVKPWLSRFIASPAVQPPSGSDDPDAPPAPMTESERRRRERADAERPSTP